MGLASETILKAGTHHIHHHDPESAQWALLLEEKILRTKKEKLKNRQNYFFAAGRVLSALLFIVGGVAKFFNFDETRRAMENFGLAAASILLPLAILIELVG